MFKHVDESMKAAANPNTDNAPGDTRLNNEANYEMSAEPITTKTTHTLQDEDAPEALMELDSMLNPEGFSNKPFQMTEMLERNQILTVSPISWSTTDPIGTRLHTVSLPRDLCTAKFFENKLANFFAIHSEMEITIKVNPTPFIQGALLLVLHPLGTNPENIQSFSYYPHELVNLPTVNHCAITVPYFSENEAYLKTDTIWEVSVYVAASLRSASVPFNLEVNLFGRFVNPELMIPVAQGSANNSRRSTSKNTEILDQKEGLVTKITGMAANFLSQNGTALSTIPVVGEFIPPLTWASRAANKVASYFGWSKPTNMENAMIMIPMPGPRMCHAEGVDNSVALALSPDNTCNTVTNSTDIDEMDFSYIFERKFINDTINMKTGHSLIYVDLHTTARNTPTNILTMFKHRRWMRCFEFHFVKTKFHTGRLLVQYDYNDSINSTTDARTAMSTVYSKIVDLSVQDSFVFTVPWMDISPFNIDTPGRLVISTFNDIVAAETVAQDIDIIVYNSYRDVQLGLPVDIIPFAQGDCCGNSAPIPTDSLIPYTPASMVEYTMGETVTSVRSLAKRFTTSESGMVTPTYTLPRNVSQSLFGQINSMYYARAGSIRYKIIIPREAICKVSLTDGKSNNVQAYAAQIYNGFMNNVVEFMVPFYYPRRRSFDLYPWPDVNLHFTNKDGLDFPNPFIEVYVAAGDDYNGMFLKGLDPVSRVSNLYTGTYDIASNTIWRYGGIAAKHSTKDEFDVLFGTQKRAALTYHHGDAMEFHLPNNTSAFYAVSFGGQTFIELGVGRTTVANRIVYSGDSVPVEEYWATCTISDYAITRSGANPVKMGRCANYGTLSSSGKFTSNPNYSLFYAKSSESMHVTAFNTDLNAWKHFIFPVTTSHLDYWVDGVTYPITSMLNSSQPLSNTYPDGASYPKSQTPDFQITSLDFVSPYVGYYDRVFEPGGRDSILFCNENQVGTYCIARNFADGEWYLWSMIKGLRLNLLVGTRSAVEAGWPAIAVNIARIT